MSLSADQVRYIAELAKLDLTDEEIERFGGQLSAILENFEQLQKLDTAAIPPTASVLPVDTVLREDEAHQSTPRDAILGNAAHQEEGMFRVDAILDDSQ